MSRPNLFTKPAEITLDTLPALFAHWRERTGPLGMSMTITPPEPDPTPPERPDGISEDEWTALGDPGRTALHREREARQTAERALAAARARPAPPKPPANEPPKPPANEPPKPKDGDLDIEAIVTRAVEAAVKPFQDAEERRGLAEAATKIQDDVVTAAKLRLHDPTDALTNIDLTKVVNDAGQADETKIKAELDALVVRKPHLAKPAAERLAPPGIGGGLPAGATDADKVKAVLADMQRSTGVRPPVVPSPTI